MHTDSEMGSFSDSEERYHTTMHSNRVGAVGAVECKNDHQYSDIASLLTNLAYSHAVGYHSFYWKLMNKPGTRFDAKRTIILSCDEFGKTRNVDTSREYSVSVSNVDQHEIVTCRASRWNSVAGKAVQIDELSIMPPCSLFEPKSLSFSQHASVVKSVIEKLLEGSQISSNSPSAVQIDSDCIDGEHDSDMLSLSASGEDCVANKKPDSDSIKDIGKGLAYLYYESDLRWRIKRIGNGLGCHGFQNLLPFVVIDCSEDAKSLHDGDGEVLNPVGWIATKVDMGSNLTFTSQVFSLVLNRSAEMSSHVVINYPDHLVTLKHMLKDGLMTDEEYKIEFRNFISTLLMILGDCEPNYKKNCTIFKGPNLEEHIREFYQNLERRNDLYCDGGIESDFEYNSPDSGSEQLSNSSSEREPILKDFIVISTDPISDDWCFSESFSNSVTAVPNSAATPLTHKMIVAALKQNNHISDETVRLLTDEDSRTNHRQAGVVLQVLLFLITSVGIDYSLLVGSFYGIRQRAVASKERNEELRDEPTVSNVMLNSVQESVDLKKEKSDCKPTKSSELKRSETRAQVIAKILYKMIEDKKYFPFDFEVQLRSLVFEQKQDVAKLRNEDGLSLLHAIAVNVRPQFLLSLFRTGCWCELRTLCAEKGPYEGKTVEDICTETKSRKLQKEMDTYTKWEKSLNQVHISARKGDFTEFKKTIKCSSDLHYEVDEMECTSLYWAVVGGNVDILKMLLSKKVDHTKVNSRKETLLHVACMMGHQHLLVTLVKDLQMDLTVKDSAKKSPLLRVAENGDEKSLSKLIKCGLKKERFGQMLAIAGHYGRLGFIKKLVDQHGTDPCSKDEAGKTAFMRACEQSRVEVAKYLLSKGVDIAETDVRRRNVLHMAADGATVDMVEFLLNEIKKKDEMVLKQMLNHRDKYIGGELCMLIRGKDKGRDSWHYVEVSRGLMDVFMKKTRSGTIDVAKYGTLLHSGWGIDPDEESSREIERRFETRRNAQMSEDLDVTPLHIAAFKDKEDVAEALMNFGSNLNTRDKFGLTPLHVAAMRGNLSIVKSMMARGAEHDVLDNLVKTPVDVAEDNEHKEVANFIRSRQYVPVAQNFRDRILPNIQNLLAEDRIQDLLSSGVDIRTHLINTLRDLTIDINESLLTLGSGPVLEESAPSEFHRNDLKE